jgi:hypothetical protein
MTGTMERWRHEGNPNSVDLSRDPFTNHSGNPNSISKEIRTLPAVFSWPRTPPAWHQSV